MYQPNLFEFLMHIFQRYSLLEKMPWIYKIKWNIENKEMLID